MAPQGREHTAETNHLNRLFHRPTLLGHPPRWLVSCQCTLEIESAEVAAPDPDLALLRFREDAYVDGGLRVADVYLIVEIAKTSLTKDRTLKAADYARAGVQDYWIVNVPEICVEVHRRPVRRSGVYRSVHSARPGETLFLAAFPELSVPVDDVLKPLLAQVPRKRPTTRRRGAAPDARRERGTDRN